MATVDGVLVMAYGTPRSLDDVEAYYTHIRAGRKPSSEHLEELKGRYRAIGGRSPLDEITTAQAKGIERRLGGPRVYLGYKHAAPFVADAVRAAAAHGARRLIGLVLAPHYSTLSVADYERRARDAAGEAGWDGKIEMVNSWHLEPGYIRWLSARVTAALASLSADERAGAEVVFTAHSLPARIVAMKDPYADQLRETAQAVAERAAPERWRVAWQSAGRTADEWLGPDLGDAVSDAAAEGATGIVVCPCGFVADHLEILYDVDIEAAAAAREVGLPLVRTQSPNDDPEFLNVVAGVIRRALAT